jgi:ubiquinone/menaquinone biosynthesis C-methylase UbiE
MKDRLKKLLWFIYFPLEKNLSKRQKWVEESLRAIPAGHSLLDAGAGESQYKKYCTHLKYTSQDFGQYDGKGNDAGFQTAAWDNSKIDIQSDISSIPVPDHSFDTILCTEVFEHIPYPDQAVKEFSRILKPGGKLITTAPFCSMTHFAPYHFATGFNIYWYQEVFKKYGFTIVSFERNGNYFDYVNQELVRLPSMLKKYSKLSYVGYLLFILIAPLVWILSGLSYLTKDSETLMCFGYHLIAEKK